MITAAIGKIFLDAYNEKYGTNYDAKTFFVEVYHPLFFGSNKYLQWISNSPFVQGLESSSSGEFGVAVIIKDKNGVTKNFKNESELESYINKKYSKCRNKIIEVKSSNLKQVKTLWKIDSKHIETMLNAFISKVNEKDIPDASIAPGYPASEEDSFARTSGQVTNIKMPESKETVYMSWIGSSLGIGLQDGLSILFADPTILLDLFDGWKLYRKVLNKNKLLRGNQVNTWNAQWLAHRYDKGNFYQERPMAGFQPLEVTKQGGLNIIAQSWTKVLIGIAMQFKRPRLMGYVYKFDKTNTTIGFIPFNLEHIRRPIQLYAKLFGTEEGRKAEELWGTGIGFKICCQKGAIGIEAMRPKNMEKYMIVGNGKERKLPKYGKEQIVSFHTYQIWLLAMLNNEELWAKSLEFAKVLYNFVIKDKTISTKRKNIVESVLTATSKDKFISSLKELLPNDDVACINDIAKIVLSMPDNNLKLFLTLIGFHYAVLDKQ